MNIETSDDFLAWQLEGLYGTEQRLVEVLDWFAEESSIDALDDSPDESAKTALAETFRNHRDQTRGHIERLDEVFDALDHRPEGRQLPAMDGLVTEAERFTNIVLNDEVRGPYFIDAGLRVERLEITAYETAIALGERLGVGEAVAAPLEATLAEEEATAEELQDHLTRMLDRLETG